MAFFDDKRVRKIAFLCKSIKAALSSNNINRPNAKKTRALQKLLRTYISTLLMTLMHACLVQADISGTVIAIQDGDTLSVKDIFNKIHRVRLIDIDAPEVSQPFGIKAKTYLSDLCFEKDVIIIGSSKDRYGRQLGFAICNGVNANEELVATGLAWVYIRHAPKDSNLFQLEKTAKASKLGIWANPSLAIAPWDWRRGRRSSLQNQLDGTALVRGNRRSKVYHLSTCPSWNAMSSVNIVTFADEKSAQSAGYRKAGNCP